jgi:hypothetical protein
MRSILFLQMLKNKTYKEKSWYKSNFISLKLQDTFNFSQNKKGWKFTITKPCNFDFLVFLETWGRSTFSRLKINLFWQFVPFILTKSIQRKEHFNENLIDLTEMDCLHSCLWEYAASRFTSKSGNWLQQVYTKLLEGTLSKHKNLKIKLIMKNNDSFTFTNHNNVEENIHSSQKFELKYQDTS